MARDNRPIWQQMGITKFKRDGEVVFQWKKYEIVLQCEDCDYHDWHLKRVNDDDQIRIDSFAELAQFIEVVNRHEFDIPYPPAPTEQQLKIKEAQARLELVNKRRREIEAEIERLKDGFETE